MTFVVAYARPAFAFVAADTRIYATQCAPDGTPRLVRVISDDAQKIRALAGGWLVDNLLPTWQPQLELHAQDARAWDPLRAEILAVGDRMLADVERQSPARAALIRGERAACVIASEPAGCVLRAVGYDGVDMGCLPDIAQLPLELPESVYRALAAPLFETIASQERPDRAHVLRAVRLVARAFRDVARLSGPRGSVSDRIQLGLLWAPAGGVVSEHLRPVRCADVLTANDDALDGLLARVALDAPDADVVAPWHMDGTSFKKVAGVSSGNQIQTASIADAQVTKAKTEARNRCKVYNSANQNITNGTVTALTFDSEDHDVGALHSTASNTSRITVPTGGDVGQWLLVATVAWDLNANGVRTVRIRRNGTTTIAESLIGPAPGGGATQNVVAIVDAPAVGDYFEVAVIQSSGGTLAVQGGVGNTFFTAIQLW